MGSDDDSESLAEFLESEVLSEVSDQDDEKEKLEEEDEEQGFRARLFEGEDINEEVEMRKEDEDNKEEEEKAVNKMLIEEGLIIGDEVDADREVKRRRVVGIWRIETGIFSKFPPELFQHILKFLSPEDLVACSLVCKFLSSAASDESLWRRLYFMRWGLVQPNRKLRDCAWKKLYIQRDEKDSLEMIRDCPSEFKMYYKQMQAAKRSQAPHHSQVLDDQAVLDKTVTDQVSIWKSSKGLTDKLVVNHACSGETCSYYQIGDAFVCERTGNVHACDDTCKEVVVNPADGLLVCTISGRCFDSLLSQSDSEPDTEVQQCGATDEAEPFMGSGRFARAYLLGYNCVDEKELEHALRYT